MQLTTLPTCALSIRWVRSCCCCSLFADCLQACRCCWLSKYWILDIFYGEFCALNNPFIRGDGEDRREREREREEATSSSSLLLLKGDLTSLLNNIQNKISIRSGIRIWLVRWEGIARFEIVYICTWYSCKLVYWFQVYYCLSTNYVSNHHIEYLTALHYIWRRQYRK